MADTLAAPIVFQCGNCHRIISDSNQLLAAVGELGVIVCDAAVGVQQGSSADAEDSSLPLRCRACQHLLGKQYQKPPQPSLEGLVHTSEQPRFAFFQSALVSYVLGSCAAQAAAAAADPPSEDAAAVAADSSSGGDAAATLPLAAERRLDALESSEKSAREQVTQLMRVVLALNQRLCALEEAGSSQAAAAGGAAGKAQSAEASDAAAPGGKRAR